MAKAGFDPHAAIELWKRLQAASMGQRPSEWMSTHPSEATRIQRLEGWMPEALKSYKPASLGPPLFSHPFSTRGRALSAYPNRWSREGG